MKQKLYSCKKKTKINGKKQNVLKLKSIKISDQLKYESYKNVLFNAPYMSHETIK